MSHPAESSTRAAATPSTPGAGRSTPLPSDEVLARRLREGDGDAGAELVRRYDALLLGYLRRLAGSEHLAEELHQATWLSVLEHAEKFDPKSAPGGFKAWLFRIATNKSNDWWRRSGRERLASAELRLAAGEGHAPTAPDPMEAGEQAERLRRAIERLPEAQREVLLLRYYSGLKFIEIASTLGCPLNTALGRMHKAMTKLKQMMEAEP